jgi:hypothetical protein
MSRPKLIKLIGFSLLIIAVFYLSGTVVGSFSVLNDNILLGSGAFTAMFTMLTVLGAKIYHLMFF